MKKPCPSQLYHRVKTNTKCEKYQESNLSNSGMTPVNVIADTLVSQPVRGTDRSGGDSCNRNYLGKRMQLRLHLAPVRTTSTQTE
ncbi:hypothetical protein ElyMa_001847200 [Elysia marginata]|uniref:Uncharacterized protein n=1 Tax=Elysia marginata TaxID=1093978 RepID=A0AAV4EKZ4_9GAST|nr:hypothetical protein ElyMa_001847200 [Elysia marginata]